MGTHPSRDPRCRARYHDPRGTGLNVEPPYNGLRGDVSKSGTLTSNLVIVSTPVVKIGGPVRHTFRRESPTFRFRVPIVFTGGPYRNVIIRHLS